MSLQFIIDGYNTVRHAQFQPPGKIKDPKYALAAFIRSNRLCGSSKNSVVIVFDGYPDTRDSHESHSSITIVFARQQSADEKIKKMVESAHNPKCIVVVSDDKEIRFSVKASGATSESVVEFLGRGTRLNVTLSHNDSRKPDLSYTQIDTINKELKKLWL